MSIVIVGGNECMECQYKEICKKHGCKAKVFTKERGNVGKKMGCPETSRVDELQGDEHRCRRGKA